MGRMDRLPAPSVSLMVRGPMREPAPTRRVARSGRRPARVAAWTAGVAALSALLPLPGGSPARAVADAPPARGARPPAIQFVETHPVETALGNPEIPETLPAWISLIRGARRTLDIEQFYLSTWPGEPMDAVMAELGRAAARGVVIRLILDARMVRTYPRAADSLAKQRNWSVRLVDFGRIAGGVQHAKFFLADGAVTFVGSQNFDWRALKHIHELGVIVRDARVTRDFQQVFEMDWAAATPAGTPPDTTRRTFRAPPRRPALPLPYRVAVAPGDTADVWPSFTPTRFIPDTTMDDLKRIVGLVDAARREIVVQLLQYSPEGRGERDPAIDDALRRAAGRGVKVKLLISDWVTGGRGLAALQDLAKDPGIEVKLSTLPEWSGGYIPFARVEHCKYMVVDTVKTWVGTSNWEPNYFSASRNLAVTLGHRGLARQARQVFETSWTAPSAATLDPNATYPPKVRGEDPPPGRKKYGG